MKCVCVCVVVRCMANCLHICYIYLLIYYYFCCCCCAKQDNKLAAYRIKNGVNVQNCGGLFAASMFVSTSMCLLIKFAKYRNDRVFLRKKTNYIQWLVCQVMFAQNAKIKTKDKRKTFRSYWRSHSICVYNADPLSTILRARSMHKCTKWKNTIKTQC